METRPEELPAEEGLPEEIPEEVAGAIEEEAPAEEAAPPAAGMVHTVEEVPSLAGKAVGDTQLFTITEISDDGNSYTLTAEGEAPAPGAEEAAAGRAAVAEELGGIGV